MNCPVASTTAARPGRQAKAIVATHYAVFSRGILALPNLSALLGGEILFRPSGHAAPRLAGVVCWGMKPTGRPAERYAARHGLPLLRLEDGFLRSVAPGDGESPLSLAIDDQGIYYAAEGPSRLETLVAQARLDADAEQRARALAEAWREGRVSKYNHAREWSSAPPGRQVLVVDQTRGDASIRFGQADAGSFRRMLEAALDEHPGATVLLKVHPEVFAGRKRGHFDRLSPGQAGRVRVLGQDVHVPGLLERAEAVYTVTSQVGFEGLLWGRPVRTFGMPFYAGWGLTRDELPAPARRGPATLESLVHAALVAYPRYVDPETGQPCEVERAMAHLALQRRMRQRFPAEVHAVGFSRWRRPVAQAFFAGSRLSFHREAATVPDDATMAVWGRPPESGARKGGVIRVEDGFLRSVGLGAELVRPLSLAMDRFGIYYDAGQPSGLERLLQDSAFDPALLARAAALRERIVQAGLTKYNVGVSDWHRPDVAGRVILVPGQVEKDASIRFGSPVMQTNLELIEAVRAANPAAWIVYKPHPDVQAGLRRADAGSDRLRALCNEIVHDVAMAHLLDAVDEVHVLTSLSGFEALLRGKPVATWGQPFYAGWGLTRDACPPARRSRRLSLDELVAGALILYPTYVSRVTGQFSTPERALEELMSWRGEAVIGNSARMRFKNWLLRHIIGLRNRAVLDRD